MAKIDGQANCEICREIMQEREWKVEPNELELSCYELFHRRPGHRVRLEYYERDLKWVQLTGNKYLCALCSHLCHGPLLLDRIWWCTQRWRIKISVYLGDFTTLRRQQQCILCQLFAKIIGRHGQFPERQTPSAKLVFRFNALKEVTICDKNGNFISSLDTVYDYELPGALLHEDAEPILRTQPIDWNKVEGWFRESKSPEILKEQPPGFRVIDVEKACVVPAPPLCEYVTLSYVWGEAPGQFQATSSNIGLLELHGSLSKPEVPTTIQDAMYVCSRLNQKYLWVDRFCIVQDHPPSRDIQINAMGSIYSHSFVTLVAMEGHDADFGLCGVSRDRMYDLSFEGIRITEAHKSLLLGRPRWKWMSRGWTLQESVLSTRLLIFTAKSLYFKESRQQWFRPDLKSDLRLQNYIDVTRSNSKDSLHWYSRNVNDYTKRTLGNPQDILRAFTGIMSSSFGQRHLFGLPLAHFGDALLWYPTGHANLRKPEGEHKYPTWSWASNTSPIEFQNCLITVASCAVIVRNAASGQWEWSVISIAGLPTNNFSNLKTGYYYMAPEVVRKSALADGELIFGLEKNKFDRNIGSTEAKLLRKFSLDNQCDSPPSWDHISIHTQKVRLKLDPRVHQVSPNRIMIILRSSKCPVGFLFLDNIESEEDILPVLRDGGEISRDYLALSINLFSEKQHVDFNGCNSTAAVMGQRQSNGPLDFLPPELVSLCSEDNDTFTLHVMAVEKSNDGIFRRIGLGQIFLEKWAELNPEVGTFMIE